MDVYICQTNPTIADLSGNTDIILNCILEASQANADVVVFSETMTTGYPAKDYNYKQAIWDNQRVIAQKVLRQLRSLPRQMTAIYGGLHQVDLSHGEFNRFNAAYIIDPIGGIRIYHKQNLPHYDVFDEFRYFKAGARNERPFYLNIQGNNGIYQSPCDVVVCEDCWTYHSDSNISPFSPAPYQNDPISDLRGTGPVFILNGSPFWYGKVLTTKRLVESIAMGLKRPIVWSNQVGAHDDIVTGGYSMVSVPYPVRPTSNDEPTYRLMTRVAKAFAEDRMHVRLEDGVTKMSYLFPRENGSPIENETKLGIQMPELYGKKIEPEDYDLWCVLRALELFVSEYCRKNGFKKVIIGSSGGIDSAVVALVAVRAMGAANVTTYGMPSKFSSQGSIDDAETLAKNLGVPYHKIPIDPMYEAFRGALLSGGQQAFNYSVTDENLQPRIRMTILMAKSNDGMGLVLTTGNKSEISVGYCTLYGDMGGSLAVIGDIPKMQVYAIAKLVNKYNPGLVPEAIIEKEPSAELRPGQKDTDSLPPYPILDAILFEMMENELCAEEVIEKLGDPYAQYVPKVYRLYAGAEYKRDQMALACKIQKRSFGPGRRMPISAKFTLAKP